MLTRLAVAASVLCLLFSTASFAQGFVQGDKTMHLGGSGSSDNDFIDNDWSIAGSLGYFFTDEWEAFFRQDVIFNDVAGSDDNWIGDSRIGANYNFDMGRWWPFVGAQIGYVYGDVVDDTWVAGPSGGVRYFVNDTTYILGRVEYEFFFDDTDEAEEALDDGRFIYTVGIGFRWQ
jgi:hypothetical protein